MAAWKRFPVLRKIRENMIFNKRGWFWGLAMAGWMLCPSAQAELKALPGHVPALARQLTPRGRLAGAARLELALSLPLRNQPELNALLHNLYNPASPDFHSYLTPDQFTERFGPTEQDYQTVINFAKTNGLTVTRTQGNRVLLDVSGRVADIEQAFHVTLRTYRHPTEGRDFFAPDTEPTVAQELPVLSVAGLTDLPRPQHMLQLRPAAGTGGPAAGSGPGYGYMGKDFRNAYVPGTKLDGTGQRVGVFELTGYDPADIAAYETTAGLPAVPLQNVLLDGADGTQGSGEVEVDLDIEMAISMATNLSAVVVFEAPTTNLEIAWDDILNAMASSNQIKQLSCSWGYSGGSVNVTADQIFQQMAAQGQSFFQASGDGDAWTSAIWGPAESPYLTVVGGTTLTMSGAGAAYYSEQVWNLGDLGGSGWSLNGNGYWGSGGGVCADYSIPWWQTNLNMTTNGGSTTLRNIPDVALTAENVYVTFSSGTNGICYGTSCAAPLWAGFMALVNQQSASLGRPSAGFINPAIYALAGSSNYTACFHDITVGNNTWSGSLTNYYAVPGYDLCTGLGTPAGTNLISALAATTTCDRSQLVWNGGFETGYLTDWTLVGNTHVGTMLYNGVDSIYSGYTVAHSGYYGMFLGDTTVATLSQALPTTSGQMYRLSFWVCNPAAGSGEYFGVNWNTDSPAVNALLSWTNPPAFSWSNLNFVVTATGTNTVLQFGAANPPNYFGLDDVTVTVIPKPLFSAVTVAGNGLGFSWTTLSNVNYLVQYKTNLQQADWNNLGGTLTANTNSLTFVDTNALTASPRRFYRVSVSP